MLNKWINVYIENIAQVKDRTHKWFEIKASIVQTKSYVQVSVLPHFDKRNNLMANFQIVDMSKHFPFIITFSVNTIHNEIVVN